METGYGFFGHYLQHLQGNPDELHSFGKQTSWDECVNEFDVDKFASLMEEVGAGYVIFTMCQGTCFLIAPNRTFDDYTGYKPGEACSKRDLVEDLYQALHPKGIKLMLYWTGDGPFADVKAVKGLVGRTFNADPDGRFAWDRKVSEEFVRRWADVAREYSLRYGQKIAGWWVDGCRPCFEYDQKKLKILCDSMKVGNPNSIVAMNPGQNNEVHAYAECEDYTAGETRQFENLPAGRWIDGKQWHILSFLGNDFVNPLLQMGKKKLDSIRGWGRPGCKYTKQQLSDYVCEVNSKGGVVSIDTMLYRDGSLDRSQLEILKALRLRIRGR